MAINLLLLIPVICPMILTISNIIFTQNGINQASATINSTNTTKGTIMNMTSIAKLHVEEAIKALENGNNQVASTRLTAALQGIAQSSNQVKTDFNEGMKALSDGNINEAIIRLKSAMDNLK
jgi:type II secretory pathway component PulC